MRVQFQEEQLHALRFFDYILSRGGKATLGAVATAYTMLGGVRAVIWTEVIQFVVMFGGLLLTLIVILVKVPIDLGAIWGLRTDASRVTLFKGEVDEHLRTTQEYAVSQGLMKAKYTGRKPNKVLAGYSKGTLGTAGASGTVAKYSCPRRVNNSATSAL